MLFSPQLAFYNNFTSFCPITIVFDYLQTADPEDLYLEFLIGLTELEVLHNTVEIEGSNTRWWRQQREVGPIDLEILQAEGCKSYFR